MNAKHETPDATSGKRSSTALLCCTLFPVTALGPLTGYCRLLLTTTIEICLKIEALVLKIARLLRNTDPAMYAFQKLQAATFAVLLRCGESEEISSKLTDYFKSLWKWKQTLQLLPVSRFSIGLFVIVSQSKRCHVYRRGVSAVLAMALCLSVSVTSQSSNEKAGRVKSFLARTLPSTYPTLCYKKILASSK